MSASDFCFLICLLCFLPGVPIHTPAWLATGFCKLSLYVSHVTSAYSMWCWAVLSTQRYTAVFRPYTYRSWRFCRNPVGPLLLVLLLCCVLNLWLPITATYTGNGNACDIYPSISSNIYILLNLSEIVWSYFFPLMLVVSLESRVLLCVPIDLRRQTNRKSSKELRITISEERKQRIRLRKLAQLQRIFLLALLDLFLSLPCHVLRLIIPIAPHLIYSSRVGMVLESVGYMLYYSLYGINGLYLWLLVFRPGGSKSMESTESQESRERQTDPLLHGNANRHVVFRQRSKTWV